MAAHGGESTRRRFVAVLIFLPALILLGFALRVHNLDAFSFWTDEGLTPERSGYAIGQILRNEIVIQGVVTTDTHPPLYYLIIHGTRHLFGTRDFAFRYPSVLFGVLLIPLIYQLARRMPSPNPSRRAGDQTPSPLGRGLGRGSSAGLIIALLATVNPLQIYYSQEARMYTLLVLLVTAMSYTLWRALGAMHFGKCVAPSDSHRRGGKVQPTSESRSHLWRRLLLYSVLAALAAYTHYTAVFLIAAQALFWAWILWRAGLRRLILGAAVAAALVAIPLIPYTIPRLLAGAEANYYAVSPLTMLLDVVRFFHLGLTVDFTQPLSRALNLLAFGLLLLGLWAVGSTQQRPSPIPSRRAGDLAPSPPGRGLGRGLLPRLFLLSWLLSPVLGLMLGSLLFKPMYQGVRHIMAASPAFLLLLGFGVWAIWTWLPRSWREPRPEPDEELTGWTAWVAEAPRANPLALIPLSLLLIGAAVALVNLYTDPAYVKDDFRAIIRFIETRAGDRDVIVYNNAVLLPLHDHYRRRPDIAVTALPAYPQVATGQEPELAALAAEFDRVWFITDPPADGRDDDRLIQGWLDANLIEALNRIFPARTTLARVIGYATPTDGLSTTALSGKWDGLPALTGAAFDPKLARPTLWVDLVWEGQPPPAAAVLVFSLTDPLGVEQFREAQQLLRDDAYLWDTAAPNRLSYALPLPPGLPPGTYTLAVAPDGGEPLALGPVTIAPTTAWPIPPEQLFPEELMTRGRPVAVGGQPPAGGIALTAVIPWDDSVIAGNNLPLTVYWRAGDDGADLRDTRYLLEVVGTDGAVLRAQEARPGAAWLDAAPPGALLREIVALYFRPETPPGSYRLHWTLLHGDAPIGEAVWAGEISVEAPEAAPAPEEAGP